MTTCQERCLDDVWYKTLTEDTICHDSAQRLYTFFFESEIQSRMSDIKTLKDGSKLFILEINLIREYEKEIKEYFKDDAEVLDLVDDILSDNIPKCLYCGNTTLNRPMISCRDVDGCIGKTWECQTCITLNNRYCG